MRLPHLGGQPIKLFSQTVRTGRYIRRLYLSSAEYIEVFLVSASAEERHLYVRNIIGRQRPRIVLCSIQYLDVATKTIEYFLQNGYSLYTHWLNPGYSDNGLQTDYLGLATQLFYRGAVLAIRDATTNASTRVQELKDWVFAVLSGWIRTGSSEAERGCGWHIETGARLEGEVKSAQPTAPAAIVPPESTTHWTFCPEQRLPQLVPSVASRRL